MALLVMALAGSTSTPCRSRAARPGSSPTDHTKATIIEVRADRLREALKAGRVPVSPVSRGLDDRDVTTLGGRLRHHGGGDGRGVGRQGVRDLHDVSGVFSADPRIVPEARRLARVSFEEMLDIAASGGRVLSLRSVEFARNHHVPLHVRSSFTWEPGTWVVEEDVSMEQPVGRPSPMTPPRPRSRHGVPDGPVSPRPSSGRWPTAMSTSTRSCRTRLCTGPPDISFTVPKVDLETSLQTVGALAPEIGAGES